MKETYDASLEKQKEEAQKASDDMTKRLYILTQNTQKKHDAAVDELNRDSFFLFRRLASCRQATADNLVTMNEHIEKLRDICVKFGRAVEAQEVNDGTELLRDTIYDIMRNFRSLEAAVYPRQQFGMQELTDADSRRTAIHDESRSEASKSKIRAQCQMYQLDGYDVPDVVSTQYRFLPHPLMQWPESFVPQNYFNAKLWEKWETDFKEAATSKSGTKRGRAMEAESPQTIRIVTRGIAEDDDDWAPGAPKARKYNDDGTPVVDSDVEVAGPELDDEPPLES